MRTDSTEFALCASARTERCAGERRQRPALHPPTNACREYSILIDFPLYAPARWGDLLGIDFDTVRLV